MEEVQVQPSVATPVPESAEITSLKKRIRSAGWAITSIGYVYLLFAVLAVLGAVAAIGSLSLLRGVAAESTGSDFSSFIGMIVVIAVISILSSVAIFLSLVVFGRRIIHVKKGVMWKAGEIKNDPNIVKYLLFTTLLSGFMLLGQLLGGKLHILDLIIAGVLFVYSLLGLLAAQKYVKTPAFATHPEVTSYKTGTRFWSVVVVIAIILQVLPMLLTLFLGDQTKSLNLDVSTQTKFGDVTTSTQQ